MSYHEVFGHYGLMKYEGHYEKYFNFLHEYFFCKSTVKVKDIFEILLTNRIYTLKTIAPPPAPFHIQSLQCKEYTKNYNQTCSSNRHSVSYKVATCWLSNLENI